MNKEAMRKHYEATPKETLINILISSREKVEKLQNRNKERKQEIERLENIIKEAKDFINGKDLKENEYRFAEDFNFTKLLEILDKTN